MALRWRLTVFVEITNASAMFFVDGFCAIKAGDLDLTRGEVG